MSKISFLELQPFYPKQLRIYDVYENMNTMYILIKSTTHQHICPTCKVLCTHYHSTYKRKIQDLPIFGHNIELLIVSYCYYCNNPNCEREVFCEDLQGVTGKYGRMTYRLEDFIVILALNTNCKCSSRILNEMGICICGNTIRSILKRQVIKKPQQKDNKYLEISNWTYRKGTSYRTLIFKEKNYHLVYAVDCKSGKQLKERISKNKCIRSISKDKISTYVKAINKALPNIIQITDQFYLYKILLYTIKKIIYTNY